VSLTFHVADMENMSAEDKKALLAEAKLAADCGAGGNITLEGDSNASFPIKKHSPCCGYWLFERTESVLQVLLL
jgi:hypothetical protein